MTSPRRIPPTAKSDDKGTPGWGGLPDLKDEIVWPIAPLDLESPVFGHVGNTCPSSMVDQAVLLQSCAVTTQEICLYV